MISPTLYSSRTDDWPTPQSFFDQLNAEFDFTLDPCASDANAKCVAYFTQEDDGLKQDWGSHRVFCNPPYGKTMRAWARKCYEAPQRGALVVLLAHSRTDTRWFHEWVYGKADSPSDVETIYSGLMGESTLLSKLTGKRYLEETRRLRREFTQELEKRLGGSTKIDEGEVLIDIPPAGRDQAHNIFIINEEGPHYIQDLSPMANAVSDTFRFWNRHFRVFCAPQLLSRPGIGRRLIAEGFWSVLSDRYLEKPLPL